MHLVAQTGVRVPRHPTVALFSIHIVGVCWMQLAQLIVPHAPLQSPALLRLGESTASLACSVSIPSSFMTLSLSRLARTDQVMP